MIMLKISYISVKFCEKNELPKVQEIISKHFAGSELTVLVDMLFTRHAVPYEAVASITIPENSGEKYCDKFLKAISLAQQMKQDIILKNELDLIQHS